MATTRLHLNPGGVPHLARLAVLAVGTASALAAPAAAKAYSWPVKPFDRQHPVRAMFGDPRIGDGAGHSHSFHFGVDVSAPDGTPVYATLTGTALIDPGNEEVVYVRSDVDATRVFAYWHVVPAVRDGQRVIARRTVVGRIARGWEHVHFAELRSGRYVNPLRPGAMAPFDDNTKPRIHLLSVERDGTAVGHATDRRGVDLVAEVTDETPLPISGRWHGRPVMPAVVRWRLVGRGLAATWIVAADFRFTIPANDAFSTTYARWTRQNKPWRNGRYRVVLAHGWAPGPLRPGRYAIEISASDLRGNTGTRSYPVEIGAKGIRLAMH
jgi:hypothetical protein